MNTSTLTLTAPGPLRQLGRCLSADYLKLRRTAALWLALAGGALPVLLNFLIFYFKGQFILKPGENPWPNYIGMSWQTASVLLLPLFVVLLSSLVANIEHRANGWKHLLAQPVARGAVFGSKLLVLLQLNLLAHVMYVALLLLSGLLLGVLRPELHFQTGQPALGSLLLMLGHTFVATLGMLGVQYVAALALRSFVGPVAMGIGGIVTAITLLRWEHIDWVPYAATTRVLKAMGGKLFLTVDPTITLAEWSSLLWFGAAVVVGYVLVGRRGMA